MKGYGVTTLGKLAVQGMYPDLKYHIQTWDADVPLVAVVGMGNQGLKPGYVWVETADGYESYMPETLTVIAK
jgi:hypothetical protein